MTDDNYPDDDRLPEDENLGTAGTPRSSGRELHTHSSNFEDQSDEQAPSFCEICGCSIPPTDSRCVDHEVTNTAEKRDAGHQWKYSHVALAIVPANSKIHALALASAVFKRRTGVPGDGRSFELIETMDSPSDTITSGWGGHLPEAVPVNDPSGKSLLESAISKLDAEADSTNASHADIDFSQFSTLSSKDYIFLENSDPVHPDSPDDTMFSGVEENGKEQWVVPALLFQRSYNTGDNPVRFRNCAHCESAQKHVFDGIRSRKAGNNRAGRWICLACHTASEGPIPRAKATWENSEPADPTEEDLDKNHHESVMSTLEEKGELE
ncbi:MULTISPECIES: hypothetical protein [Haloferacaceae]|uniref:Uncharacterized protein n=2 Tax=Haloferacaceae TaxID=1644056 RepID=A0ABD6DDE8_9EURY|nr:MULTISPECIES: hypothetical protein [Halorubraceae]